MFASIMRRMANRVLSHAGVDAVLRGSVPCRAIIERGVEVKFDIGQDKFYNSEFASVVDVGNLLSGLSPVQGDTLAVTWVDGTSTNYTLDALLANNGDMSRFVLLAA